jgi:hypothetical protein
MVTLSGYEDCRSSRQRKKAMNGKVIPIMFWWFVSLLLLAPSGLAATTFTWDDGNNDWQLSDKWSPTGIPGYGDAAIINNGSEVTVSRGEGITQLQVASGNTLKVTGTLGMKATSTTSPAYILNDGIIKLGGPGYIGNMTCWESTVTFQGSGNLVLGRNYLDSLGNNGYGGGYVNTASHTIRGGGFITLAGSPGLTNQGQVIADNGTLYIETTVDNTGGTMSAIGSGNVLAIYGGVVNGGTINPQDGKVTLAGNTAGNVTFGPGAVEVGIESDPGGHFTFQGTVILDYDTTLTVLDNASLSGDSSDLVNHGAILMIGTSGNEAYVYGPLTFQESGSLTMGGEGNIINGNQITNSAPHTIQGGGTITGGTWDNLTNNGTIIANNAILNLDCPLTGTGTVAVADDASLNVTKPLQTGDLTLSHLANLTVNISGANFIDLKRNFSFAQTDSARWNWGDDGLILSGQGPWQTIEVGGQDHGADATGLTNNFALPKLRVDGAGTQVKLVDQIDNGHRFGGREVLYVATLLVQPEATLNLNGLKLYAKRGGTIYRVRAGQGSLYGGGQIIDAGALPSVNMLLLN